MVRDGEEVEGSARSRPPYPCQSAADVVSHCDQHNLSLAEMVRVNERVWFSSEQLEERLRAIWLVMLGAVHAGCHTRGVLPGGLSVERRAAAMHAALRGDVTWPGRSDPSAWLEGIRAGQYGFRDVLKFVSCFALATNEENASLGRVVTAPTNGAAGVIPAVLLYHVCFADRPVPEAEIFDFLMVAGEIGSLFKKGATISAAMGGCQAEIGVSSAMAAAALTEVNGGTVGQALLAAEVAMEHHLGMTCDPVQGLVQVPCIERNAMGAVKAINAAELALVSDPAKARVSLDDVIRTMQQTAQDMNTKYKETSLGGLAANISVRLPNADRLRGRAFVVLA